MDIVVWLRSLGLGKYEAIFRDNEIDEPVLPNLTVNDLKELGVTATAASCWMPSLFCDEGGEAPSVEWQPGAEAEGGREFAHDTAQAAARAWKGQLHARHGCAEIVSSSACENKTEGCHVSDSRWTIV